MKVALELQPCCGNRSGIGTYTYELARRLRGGDNLEFVGNLFDFRGKNHNADFLRAFHIPIREQKSMPYGVYRRVWHTLPLSYPMMFPKADLSVFFNYIVPPRISGKVIDTLCDMTYLRYPETMSKSNYRRITRDIRYSVERSAAILTISEFSKREIHQLLGVPEEKIFVLYCASSVQDRQLEQAAVLKKHAIRSPYLLYVGNMEPRKNINGLLRAYRHLKREFTDGYQLVLAGGSGWNTEEIYREIGDLRESGDVVLTGYISPEEKNTLYANASAFLFPSLYEGFGIPPLEAMHFGCPVVCSDAASLPEVVGDAAELVDPSDPVSIAEGVMRVLSDREYAQSLIQRGFEREKLFTWEQSAEKLRQLCVKLLAE